MNPYARPYSPYTTSNSLKNPLLTTHQKEILVNDAEMVGSVHQVNNWALIFAIFFLFPLFCIKLSECAFMTRMCSQVDLTPAAAEECENKNIHQQNLQYLSVLVLGGLGVVFGVIIGKSHYSYRAAAFGLCYGGFATILYAVCANYSRLTSLSQVSITALLLAAFIFLPPLTSSVLLS